MRKILIAILALLVGITQVNSYVATYAVWNSLKTIKYNSNIVIPIGIWGWSGSTLLDNAPIGTVDLDALVEFGGINTTITLDGYFIYEDKLFRVTSPTGYNPSWHGLPGDSSAGWAFISMTLDWLGEHQRYSNGAIIRVGNRFFQAMHQGNMVNPLTNNGPINSGKPWREVQPMEDYMFPFISGTTLRDYTSPIPEYIIPM